MKIASVVADLLYTYECVVIPGLGGFITKTHPAKVHPVKDQFKPPYKEIVFNPHLRTNDGMLLNYIAQQETLPYSEAKQRLDRFVLKCLNELDKGKKISFRNIGRIYYDEEKQIVFQADKTQNYLADSFGLSDFVSPSIKREGFQEKLEKTFQQKHDEKERPLVSSQNKKTITKQNPLSNRIQQPVKKIHRKKDKSREFWGVVLLILGIILVIGYASKDNIKNYYASYAGWFPLFYASPNEYVAHHLDKIPVEKIIKDAPSIKDISFVLDDKNTHHEITTETSEIIDLEIEKTKQITEEPATEFSKLEPKKNNISFETKNTDETSIKPKEDPVVAIPIVEAKNSISNYYIIAGVFSSENNAHQFVKALKDKGFASELIGKTKTGKWRVAYERHNSQQEADRRLVQIRNEQDKNAWLLKF